MIERYEFFNNLEDSNVKRNVKMIIERILIILAISGVTCVIPSFVDFINIFGTLGIGALGFIFPCLLYIQFVGIKRMKWWLLAFNIFILAFGIGGGSFSIY